MTTMHEPESHDAMTAQYRRSRGWSPDPGPTSRISVALPRDLIRRLNRQSRLSGIPRQQIIEAAIEGIVSEWEQIDEEESSRPANANEREGAAMGSRGSRPSGEKQRMRKIPHEYVDGGLTAGGKERGCVCCGIYEAYHDLALAEKEGRFCVADSIRVRHGI